MAKIIEIEDYGGAYSKEQFVNLPRLSRTHAKTVADSLNAGFPSGYYLYWKVVADDYIIPAHINRKRRSAVALAPVCPYCQRRSRSVAGTTIYPHRKDLAKVAFFLCRPCDAYVGTHHKTGRPLGTLANAELRAARKRAHAAFDPSWKQTVLSRSDAYAVLAVKLGIDYDVCHIGMFDLETCQKVIELYPVDLAAELPILD